MATLLLLCACASAASPIAQRFVRIDQQPELPPRSEPPWVLVDQEEIAKEPPFRCVGVIEVRGSSRDSVAAFLSRIGELGAQSANR